MKKSVLFLVLILILPTIFAVEFQMNQEFAQGETIFAKISGNFVDPLIAEDIYFYRGHTRVSFLYDITKINNEFYIYAQTGDKTPNNYSIEIKNAKYYQINKVIEEDLTKNFTITENTADFSVTPGFVKTNESFYLTIQNLQNFGITVTKDFEESSEEYGLFSGEIKQISFNIEEQNKSSFSFVTLSSENTTYEIPIYLFTEDSEKELNFRFNPADLSNITLPLESGTKRITYLLLRLISR